MILYVAGLRQADLKGMGRWPGSHLLMTFANIAISNEQDKPMRLLVIQRENLRCSSTTQE